KAMDNVKDLEMDSNIATDELMDIVTSTAGDIITETNSSSPSISAITNDDEIISRDDGTEFEISYKLIIKTVEGTSLPSKWFKESVSTIDGFLLSIHNKTIMLIKDNTLLPTDYSVAFKTQKKAGAGTQLTDTQDFIKFKAEYLKIYKQLQKQQ
ncbi:1694_t:CDS:2, partial [Racocetra fulgida]